MKKKIAIETIAAELETFRSHDIDETILEKIRETDVGDVNTRMGITINDLHVLSAVPQDGSAKIAEIVDSVPLTQGAVSKVLSKLTTKGLVSKFHQPNNKKDTFVQLTTAGEKVNQLHHEYHQAEAVKLEKLVAGYSKGELETIASFLVAINKIRQ